MVNIRDLVLTLPDSSIQPQIVPDLNRVNSLYVISYLLPEKNYVQVVKKMTALLCLDSALV